MGKRIETRVAVAATALAALVAPVLAWAAPPANNELASAQVLPAALPVQASGSNIEADREIPFEPNHAGYAGQPPDGGFPSVWYSWTPTADVSAVVEADVCDPEGVEGPDLLAVYEGSAYPLGPEQGHDSGKCVNKVPFAAVAGTTYSIAVAGSDGLEGPFTIRIRQQTGAPLNDDFANALPLTEPLKLTFNGNNVNATGEAGEPDHAGDPSGGSSVWYRWTSPATQRVRIDTCQTQTDTLLGVYAGTSLAQATPVAADDDSCSASLGDALIFTAQAGRTYRIAVDGYKRDEGDFILQIARSGGGTGGVVAIEGKLFAALRVVGRVMIKRPGTTRPVRLTAGEGIPVGSVLDTVNGRVTLGSLYNGVSEQVTLFDGRTRVTQKAGKRPYVVAGLTGKLNCAARAGSADAGTAAKRRKRGRRLWANGSGHFKTRGRQASATVRGTKWLTYDKCNRSTLVWVKRGALDVKAKGVKGRIRIDSETNPRYTAKPKRR